MKPVDAPGINLLAIVGASPSIVTETIFRLAVVPLVETVPVVVVGIRIVTTSLGRDKARADLGAALTAMASDYPEAADRLPLAPGQTVIEVPQTADGHDLDDIRSTADAAAMADTILGAVVQLTTKAAVPLHASLAGGRKTMTYALGQAMSLCARPQDRLSHVLVDPVAERCSDFFYPAPSSRLMETNDGSSFDAADIHVELYEVPFPRLRTRLAQLPPETTFWQTVAHAQVRLEPLVIAVDFRTGQLTIGGKTVGLTPIQTVIYMIVAAEVSAGRAVARDDLCDQQEGRLVGVATWIYTELLKGDRSAFFDGNEEYEGDTTVLRSQISRMRATLRKVLPESIAEQYLSAGRGDITLSVDPSLIEIRGMHRYEARLGPAAD